jgi:hypothetical protein
MLCLRYEVRSDGVQMNAQIEADKHFALKIQRIFLISFYRMRYELGGGGYRLHHRDEMDVKHGVDVEAGGLNGFDRIQEKCLKPRKDGRAPILVTCEIVSNVNNKSPDGWGWMAKPSKATVLLQTYPDSPIAEEATALDCLWIPYRRLRLWFFLQDWMSRWPVCLYGERTINCYVPIEDIEREVGFERFMLHRS